MRQPTRAFPVLRLASVLASILLVVVVAGDLLTAPNYQAAQLDRTNQAVEMAAPQAPEAGEIEAPAQAQESQAYSEKSLEPEATASGPRMMVAAPTEEAQGTSEAPAAALALPSGGGGQPPEDQATDTAGIAASSQVLAPTETIPPAETPAPAENLTPTEAPATVQAAEPAVSMPSGRSYWRVAEILLALIAITSGLVAYVLRRAAS